MVNRKLRILRALKISKTYSCPDNNELLVDVPNWYNPLTYIYIGISAPIAFVYALIKASRLCRR